MQFSSGWRDIMLVERMQRFWVLWGILGLELTLGWLR